MGCASMGVFTHDEWLTGMHRLECDSLARLRPVALALPERLHDREFSRELHRFAFDFARDADRKSVDIPTAIAMLSIVLGDRFPHANDFFVFLDVRHLL